MRRTAVRDVRRDEKDRMSPVPYRPNTSASDFLVGAV